MDNKSKIFFIIFGLLIVISVFLTYYRIVIKRDYIIEAQADCDPMKEECFIQKCDPASTEEGEACTGDPEVDTTYYKLVRRNARYVPLCDPAQENCDALACQSGEADCEYVYCTDGEGQRECNNPTEYAENHPIDGGALDDSSCSDDICTEPEIKNAINSIEADVDGNENDSAAEITDDESLTGSSSISEQEEASSAIDLIED